MTLKMMSVSSLMFLDLEITQMIPKVQEPRGKRGMLTSHQRDKLGSISGANGWNRKSIYCNTIHL